MTGNDQPMPPENSGLGKESEPTPMVGLGALTRRDRSPKAAWWLVKPSTRAERRLIVVLGVLMIVFSAIPIANDLWGKPNKDYSLWCQVGVVLRQGMNIYPEPGSGRMFPFMYPPSAAAILGFLTPIGSHGTTILLVLSHSAAWIGAIVLSVWLATGGKIARQHPALYLVPSLCIIALIHNTYMLGQPNLMLLTLLLGAFACLRLERQGWAGFLVATAAAIKAFPILALGYFVYRRLWRAAGATVLWLTVWLLVVPLPFRTPTQAVQDVVVWSKGMVFTYNAHGIAQRPYRSFSFKNQSIMGLAHRLLRDVPADGEAVLTRHIGPRRSPGEARVLRPDGSIDLKAMLTAPVDAPDWAEQFQGAENALRKAWRVNVASLGFRTVTAITLAAMFALSLFVVAVMPPARSRTAQTDALEFALITLLIVMFSPLSFNYAFVWLIYPMTVGLHLVVTDPAHGRRRHIEIAWVAAVVLIPATAIAFPLYAQAYGNLFVPALLLVFGLGLKLRQYGKADAGKAQAIPAHAPHQLAIARPGGGLLDYASLIPHSESGGKPPHSKLRNT